MLRNETMQTAILTFVGGPLDGETRRRQVQADWMVIRYTEPASGDAKKKHVYAGLRSGPDDTAVAMRYLGVTMGEEGGGDETHE